MSENNNTYDISYNLFNYAYKELSQDAVICWLIKWAYYDGPDYEQLKKCGKKFLEALFAKHNEQVPEGINNPEIWQQNNSIDVLARIGDYILLIEDKTGTKDHSNQLEEYYQKVLEGNTSASENPVEEEFIIPIYLKTGNQSLLDHMRIEHSTRYKVFDRRDFLAVVQPYRSAHPILNDFTNYLEYVDDKTQSYCEQGWEENQEGNWLSWESFFRELEDSLVVFDEDRLVGFNNENGNSVEHGWADDWIEYAPWGWNYVPNRSGGFLGFWCYFKTVRSCGHDVRLYLQLEINPNNPDARKLCFKVSMDEVDVNIKWDCHARILEAGGDLVREPDRMGHGKTVTIAEWTSPWLVFRPNGGPDIPAIVNNLMEAQTILDGVEDIGDAP